VPTRIVATPNAPVVLTSCRSNIYDSARFEGINNAMNRSDVFLVTYAVRWNVYDHSGTSIYQYDANFRFDSNLAPGDQTNKTNPIYTNNLSSVGSVTCRLQSATFEGGKSWTYGRAWTGKLSPIPSSQSMNGGAQFGSQASVAPSSDAQPSGLNIAVTNAWNDAVNGATFVHDTISIQGGASDVSLNPAQFTLTMSLANGARKTYYGLTQPAPTYQKLNPLGSTTMTAYEVDPRTDLGSIGSIIVPAHGNVTVTVTFAVPDVIANANDNKTVAVR
jgi:hypothetical protein